MAAGDTVITLVGNLVDDPELRFTPSGAAVAKFRIASTPRLDEHLVGPLPALRGGLDLAMATDEETHQYRNQNRYADHDVDHNEQRAHCVGSTTTAVP